MTSLTTPKETGRGADIPAPRGGQGVRLLVLGADEDARLLREQVVAAGYELAQRYSARVSHVAYGAGVDPGDTRYAKIRDAGLTPQPISACAAALGLAPAPTVPAPAKGESASVKARTEPAPARAESEPEVQEPQVESEPESGDFFEDDDLLDEPGGPDPLAYPPLPEESADSVEQEEIRAFRFEDSDVDVDVDLDVEVHVDVDAEVAAEADDDADAEGDDAVALASAMIGADPWPGPAQAERVPEAEQEAETHESAAVEEAEGDGFDFALEDVAGAEAPAAQHGPRTVVFSFVWALVPLVSFGLLTPVVFGYAAVRTRSRLYAAATLGYALAVVLAFALSATHPQAGSVAHGSDGLLTFALALSWLGGTGHALSARPRVFGVGRASAAADEPASGEAVGAGPVAGD
ncbi:hypothetical protein KDL01_31900 [Actinospica durhamensis]|uniref:Uncharacterized protein n=1 Tax=Actinospica durhamensis TaxID=1508375 RepID=A0A941EVX2_9ACTN|nr:hypothetical protein [Actinospica durhamensis]MBR7837921.1 hypothetical protein [Actinospica durhamensis]